MSLPRVVVAHAGTQHAYETVAGLQHSGELRRFVTSVYRREGDGRWRWLPAGLRARAEAGVRKRWHPEVDATRVDEISAPFLAMRGVSMALRGAGLARFAGIEQLGDAWFDRRVAARLRSTGATQVHAFEGTALHTMAEARRLGMRSVLDVPSAHEYNRTLVAAEARATGLHLEPSWASYARVRRERELADWILAPSPFVRRCLVEHGVPPHKIVEVPFGADTARFTPASEPPRRFVLLYVASINLRKGTRYLLQAWRELALPDAELVLAGAPDAAGAHILREYGGACRWLGHVPWYELPDVFRAASAFVLPSLAEGSAVVTYQAMAAGLPLIVTEDAGSVATDGREGFVIPSRDVAALKDRILRLYERRDDAAAMGRAGRRLIEERYTWRHYQRRIAAVHAAVHAGADPRAALAAAQEVAA